MKHFLPIILSLFTLSVCAQDSLNYSMPVWQQTEFDRLLLEHTMQWIDTTGCTASATTDSLPDSVYIARLRALPCIVEMPYNTVVRSFIEMYVMRRPRQVAKLKMLGQYYFPIFEDALHRYGLPDELKYLPVIESGLNPTACSHMGAAGLWQFMPRTAKNSGLEVNSLIDERFDPLKATDAACRFLKSLYRIYGDWNLVIAAYNCGPGNINKAVHRSGGKKDFWDLYPYLPRETRSYLPIFIAATYAMNYADEHDICTALPDRPLATDTILTDRRLHLLQVEHATGLSIDDLRRLNPQYRMDILPGGKPYALCLPIDQTGIFIQAEDSVYAYLADSLINNRREVIDLAQKTDADGLPLTGVVTYKVKAGDTLGAIANKYHTTVSKIQKANHLKSTTIQIGQQLKIPR